MIPPQTLLMLLTKDSNQICRGPRKQMITQFTQNMQDNFTQNIQDNISYLSMLIVQCWPGAKTKQVHFVTFHCNCLVLYHIIHIIEVIEFHQ